MRDLSATLKKIITEHGLEILQQEQRLKAILDDLHPQEKRMRHLLDLSIRYQIPQKLLALKCDCSSVFNAQVNAIKHYFKEEYFLEDIAVKAVFDCWLKVFPESSTNTNAQFENEKKNIELTPLTKVQKGHFWGLQNSDGDIIISCKYENISDFKDGVATVTLDGKSGLINNKGFELTSVIFDNRVINFVEGLAIVRQNGKYSLINLQGKKISKLKYDHIERTGENYKIKLADKFGLLDKKGKEISPIKYDKIENFDHKIAKVNITDKWGFINELGVEVQPLKYAKIDKLNENLYICESLSGYNLIDIHGIDKFECTFKNVFKKYSGHRRVQVDNKFGFIDEFGNFVIKPKFNEASDFIGGYSIVKIKQKVGVIDEYNGEVISIKYDNIRNFSNGLFEVELEKKLGVIDGSNNLIIPMLYDKINYNNTIGYFVCKNSKYGILDKKGDEILPILYDFIDDNISSLYSSNLIIAVKYRNKFGFVDKSGKKVMDFKYDIAKSSSNGIALAHFNNNYCFTTLQGKENILYYDTITKYSDDFFVVIKYQKYGAINSACKEIIPIKYKAIQVMVELELFGGSKAIATDDENVDTYDFKGNKTETSKYFNLDVLPFLDSLRWKK